ncbi:MAG: LPS export ABC transporter ATP-binding protein [Holosporales bacterium]|jgi:lipopolysaccharide export system ATP-binding protein|nr:LPS export ABC transporter ATP-binding protein [Holosporales bacterium]
MSSTHQLSAKELLKSVGNGASRRIIVDEASIHIHSGEVVALLGPNGAGKTTCFSILCGLQTPDKGSVFLDTHDISQLPMYRRARLGIGYLPQEPSIFRGLSVEDNILAVIERIEPDKHLREERMMQLLRDFSIVHLRKAPSLTLSGGERRRLEIARALATNPLFVLLDEPLAGIDPIAVNDIRTLIHHLKDRGIGVLITDHNVRDTLTIADRAYIMCEGKILAEGSPEEIINNENARRVYFGESFALYT